MLTKIKKNLKKYNGAHSTEKLNDIVDELKTIDKTFTEEKIKKIVGKYSNIENNELVVDTKTPYEHTFEELEKMRTKKEKKETKFSNIQLQILERMKKTNFKAYDEKDTRDPPPAQLIYKKSDSKIDNKNTVQFDDVLTPEAIKESKIVDELMAIEYPPQRSEKWFELRDNCVTASDIGMVLGDSKYEKPYTIFNKKVKGKVFQSNEPCYHGKKLEHIATMIYSYRNNVQVHDFGLIVHPKYSFIGASPDGIVGKYKLDGIHKTNMVGRMLEIKIPLYRHIIHKGNIKGTICPIHYWDQTQTQQECCDLNKCDFLQCKIDHYNTRVDFLNDTNPKEPFKSLKTGHEKGVLIQLLPKDKLAMCNTRENYLSIVYDVASFIYPPKIDMSPEDCDTWCMETIDKLSETHPDCVLDKILYWKLNDISCVTIERDKKWFEEKLPIVKKIWDNITFLRKNKDKAEIIFKYLDMFDSEEIKNEKGMEIIDFISNPPTDKKEMKKYDKKINDLIEYIEKHNCLVEVDSDGEKM